MVVYHMKFTWNSCVFIGRHKKDDGVTKSIRKILNNLDFKNIFEDFCRLLNCENNEVNLNIGGYKYDKRINTFLVFINYDKSHEIQDTIKYEDRFINCYFKSRKAYSI